MKRRFRFVFVLSFAIVLVSCGSSGPASPPGDNPTQAWIKQFGTLAIDQGVGVAADGSGNVYVTGLTLGSLNGSNAGEQDVFLAKYTW